MSDPSPHLDVTTPGALEALAAAHPDHADRRAAESHAAGCAPCRDAFGRALALNRALAEDTLEGPSPDALTRTLEALAEVEAELAPRPSVAPAPVALPAGLAALPALAAAGAFLALVAIGHHSASGATAWALALSLGLAGAAFAGGTALPALARVGWPLLTVAFAAAGFEHFVAAFAKLGGAGAPPDGSALTATLLAAIPFAFARDSARTALVFGAGAVYLALRAGTGLPALLVGDACAWATLGTSVLPLAAATYVARRMPPELATRVVARGAVGGAVAGTGALVLVCHTPASAPHNLISHGAGLAAAAALGAVAGHLALRFRARPAGVPR